jgi:outer membrane protein OmpA-like peptidoglycan-associated protein
MGVTLLLATTVAAAPVDNPKCKDHPLFPTRMPGYVLEACQTQPFGSYEFWAASGPKTPVEGKFTFLTYALAGARETEPSGIEVVRNYENAAQKIGATLLQTKPGWWRNGKVVKGGAETWFQVEKGNGRIWLRVVEKQAMAQHVVADAAALGSDIRATGHVAVYGVLFDTDSAAIKPESAAALAEIAALLRGDPTLKVFVVGHTDTTGSVEHNVQLSQARAESVRAALTATHGIAAERLRAFGCGPFAPVASNDSEDGRAKNRRVELVKQ